MASVLLQSNSFSPNKTNLFIRENKAKKKKGYKGEYSEVKLLRKFSCAVKILHQVGIAALEK